MARRLPAEWEPCDGVLLAWPHANSDWRPVLSRIQSCVATIAAALSTRTTVLLLCNDPSAAEAELRRAGAVMDQLRIIDQPVGDTWCRDYGPLGIYEDGRPLLLDWGFNGWGLKYRAATDNLASRRLHAAGHLGQTPLITMGLILEGGSLESDGAGTLLSTVSCLCEANRNPHLDLLAIKRELVQAFGAQRLVCLQYGQLDGDDTDGHIDTLARLAPAGRIVYVACNQPQDDHFAELAAMADELRTLRTLDGRPYDLLPLPWPQPQYSATGDRLPATYANYLVCNDLVLVPTYADPADEQALAVIAQAFPGHQVQGIDCRAVIAQHGSLHCLTMQLPRGVLTPCQESL